MIGAGSVVGRGRTGVVKDVIGCIGLGEGMIIRNGRKGVQAAGVRAAVGIS